MAHHTQNDGIISTEPGCFLHRPHLDELFLEAMKNPLITVVAGAGYGKTQAVASFLQNNTFKAIWLQLSTLDNLTARLWDRFMYAISLQNKELPAKLGSLGFPESLSAFSVFLNYITNELIQDTLFIVFDDYHLLHDSGALQFVERLIESQVIGLKIIIISRQIPSLNTIGYMSKGIISMITEENLRLSKSEVSNYFYLKSFNISDKMISNIYEYTDGWILAIYLISLSLRNADVDENKSFSILKPDLFKLMEHGIFRMITKELQIFLIKLSFLDTIPFELISELAAADSILLDDVIKISSFIRRDGLNAYRIHHLFLEFLSQKQTNLKKEEIIKTHRRVAYWFKNNGYNIDAITYFQKAGEYTEIFHIMSDSHRCLKSTAKFYIEVLENAPKKFYEQNPLSKIFRAKFLANNLEIEEAIQQTSDIIQAYESLPLTEEVKCILGEAYILMGLITLLTSKLDEQYKFKFYFKKADEYLPNGSAVFNADLDLTMFNYTCSLCSHEKSSTDHYIEALFYALPYATKVMHGCGSGVLDLALAETAYFRKDFRAVEKHAYLAIKHAKIYNQCDIETTATFFLIRTYVALGNYPKTVELLHQLNIVAEKRKFCESYEAHDLFSGWFYAMIGQKEKVARWIADDIENLDAKTPALYEIHRLVCARYYFAKKQYFELLAFLGKCSREYILEDFIIGRIEMKVLKAITLNLVHETKEAIQVFTEAYHLALSNEFFMPFIENGNHMRTLTRKIINSKGNTIPVDWLENICTKSSTYAKNLGAVAKEYCIKHGLGNEQFRDLSRRELQVLTCLCHGLTRNEIADSCNLSINTVKNMLQLVYDKLGVTNSLDAVRVATLMNILE